MRKIACFTCLISILAIVALLSSISGCVSTIASVGEVGLKTYLHSKAEEAKARRQAKYIAEEIAHTEKKDVIYTKKDFKVPDKVIRINEEAEVYMYYEPANSKIKLLAFTGDKLTNSGSGNMAEANNKSEEQLRKEFINLFPCYEHLRVDALTGATTPVKTSAPSPALGSIPTTGFMPR